jgi:hypothetical protein
MQKSDREFIEKYKQNQFEMHNPVPQKVTKEATAPVAAEKVIKEAAAPVAAEKVIKEAAAPVAAEKVTKEAAAPVAAEKVTKEAAAPVAAIQMIDSSKIQDDLTDDENQPNPLELIQSALQQINYALHLLNGVKKTSSPEIRAKSASEPILPKAQIVSDAILPEPPVVSEAILSEAHIVSEAILPIQNPIEPVPASDYISDVDVDVDVEVQKEEEEFKIVMPKKLKNKKTVTTLFPMKEITKKDDFPSLGSSFAPVKTGFWSGTVKKSLEIAKSIAHIPSPPPKKSIGIVRCGPSKDDLSEEEDFDTTEEYHIRKRYGEEDDDNWQ